ncbi:hypothetical protein HY623_02645 [Candidatus Uhrbacteria bacterium]|nr:hypothetical protein [Candidatus Uhrbacteria bacterium]
MRFLTQKKLFVISIVIILALPEFGNAQLSSDSFRVTSDSVNCGGGGSTSNSFAISSTICEPSDARTLTSTSFVAESGFQYMEDTPFITVSLLNAAGSAAKNSIAYGSMTPTSGTKSDSILVRVTTNAANGYVGSILSDGLLRTGSSSIDFSIQNVADGSVDGSANGSPSGESGFSVSSSDTTNCTRPSGDQGIVTSGTPFATCTTWKTQSDNTLTFKAAVSSNNLSGSYSQNLTIVVTGSF